MYFNTYYEPQGSKRKLDEIVFKEAEKKNYQIRKSLREILRSPPKEWEAKFNDGKESELPQDHSMIGIGPVQVLLPKNPYYFFKKKKNAISYSYTETYSGGIVVNKVPQSVLGESVLGRAFIGLNYIEILDSLHGLEYQEVMRHELNHIHFPHLTEYQVREKTRNELPFAPKYH